jgi:hypothetical protein
MSTLFCRYAFAVSELVTPALMNSSIAAGPNSGAMRRKLVDACSAATMFFDLRAFARLPSSEP